MILNGTDFMLIAVIFGFLGSFILAKGAIFRHPKVRELEASAFYGHNPFLIKSGIIKQEMTKYALGAFICSSLFTVLGTYLNIKNPMNQSFLLSSSINVFTFLLLSVLILYIAVKIVEYFASKEHMPSTIDNIRKAFDKILFTFRNGMDEKQCEAKAQLTEEQKQSNKNSAKETLQRWALLIGREDLYQAEDLEGIISYLQELLNNKEMKRNTNVKISSNFVQAWATVVLVFVTMWYVHLTNELVKRQDAQLLSQEKQFEVMNRGSLGIENIEGDIAGGLIPIANIGSLPVDNVSIMWKIVTIEGDVIKKVFPLEPKGQIEKNEISFIPIMEPEDVEKIAYSSNFNLKEEPAFLIVAWAYTGKGIKGIRSKEAHFLWYTQNPNHLVWVPSSVLASGHIKVIREMKEKLRTTLLNNMRKLEIEK